MQYPKKLHIVVGSLVLLAFVCYINNLGGLKPVGNSLCWTFDFNIYPLPYSLSRPSTGQREFFIFIFGQVIHMFWSWGGDCIFDTFIPTRKNLAAWYNLPWPYRVLWSPWLYLLLCGWELRYLVCKQTTFLTCTYDHCFLPLFASTCHDSWPSRIHISNLVESVVTKI